SRVDVRGIRRTQILDAAQRLVAERGWNGTTFADICREAGVSNGVLTYHFRDKEDLRQALFGRELERWRVYFGAMAGKDTAPAHHAAGAVKGASARIENDPEFFRTLFSYLCCDTAGRPELAARVHEFFAEMQAGIAAHFAHNAARGELGGRDPEEAASGVQTGLLGYALGRSMLGIDRPTQGLADLPAS